MSNSSLLLIAIISGVLAAAFGVFGFFLNGSSFATLDLAAFLIAIVITVFATVRAWVNEKLRPLDGGFSPH